MKKNTTIQSILTHLAQDAALPNEIDIWPTLQARLAKEQNILQAKKSKMNTRRLDSNHNLAAITGALVLLLALGMIFVLPQGRVWAKNVLRFFLPTADQIPLPTSNPVNLIGITPGVLQPTLTPAPALRPAFIDSCGESYAPRCTLEQIRQMVNFPVKAIAVIPQGMQFIGATGGPDEVTLVYQRDDPYSFIMLIQSPLTTSNIQTAPVGSSAVVEEIPINRVTGEYVSGGYFHFGGDTEAKWDAAAEIQSLRWEENGIRYTITLTGSADFTQQRLDKTGLASLAAALTDQVTQGAIHSDADHLKKFISEVEQDAGFDVIEPAWLPKGFRFEYATYFPDSQTICLQYHHSSDLPLGNSSNPPAQSLTIAESVTESLPAPEDLVVDGLRPDQVFVEKAELRVGGALNEKGLYAYGSLNAGKICNSQSFQNQVLFIQAEGLSIAIISQKEGPIGSPRNWLTRQEMVRLAESITGVRTVGENELDPEFLTSIQDIKNLASLPLKLPTKLPEGMNFTYGQVSIEGTVEKVILHYSDGKLDISIRLVKDSTDTLDMILQNNPEAYRQITIHNQPALISQGYWNENGWKELPNGGDGGASVTWFEDGIKYSVSGFNAYPSQVWIEIAESIE